MSHRDDDNTQSHIVLAQGTMVHHYRIIERIGAGGMGEVYLADELGFDRGRIVGWAYSQAVLAAVWSIEEGANDWKGWLAWSREISPLL